MATSRTSAPGFSWLDMLVGENGVAFQRFRGNPPLRKFCLPGQSCKLAMWWEKNRHHYSSQDRKLIITPHLTVSSFLSFVS